MITGREFAKPEIRLWDHFKQAHFSHEERGFVSLGVVASLSWDSWTSSYSVWRGGAVCKRHKVNALSRSGHCLHPAAQLLWTTVHLHSWRAGLGIYSDRSPLPPCVLTLSLPRALKSFPSLPSFPLAFQTRGTLTWKISLFVPPTSSRIP